MSEVITAVRTRFDEEAEGYWRHHYGGGAEYPALMHRQNVIHEMLGAAPGRTLDVGCGPGILATEITGRGGRWFGLDISFAMLEAARGRLSKSSHSPALLSGGIHALPFPSGTFQTVVAAGVLEYFDEHDPLIHELARVTKPGGSVIISMPTAFCLPRLPYQAFRSFPPIRALGRFMAARLDRSRPSAARRAPAPTVYRRVGLGEFSSALARNGLDTFDHGFFHYHVLPQPLDEYFPAWARRLGEPLEKRPRSLGFLASGMVVAARKRS